MKLKAILTTAVVGAIVFLLGAAAQAQAAPFVYVTNADSGNASQYDAAGGALSPLSPPTVSTVTRSPGGVAVTPDGKTAYVTTTEFFGTPEIEAAILQYSVGTDGALRLQASAPLPPNANPGALVVRPDGRSLYAINPSGNGSVIQYTVEPGGALTLKAPATVPTAEPLPTRLAISPDGKSLYVTTDFVPDGQMRSVSQYTVALDGTLSPKSPPAVPSGSSSLQGATGVAVSPDSRSVYVADDAGLVGVSGVISQYTAGADGTLSAKSPPTVPTGNNPFELEVSPDGQSLYLTDSEVTGAVFQYTVGPGGELAPKSPATVLAGTFPTGMAISGDGRNVYAANSGSNTVSQYSVGIGGALSPLSPGAVATGSGPLEIAVTPPPRVPTSIEQCKNGGWQQFGFKSQGGCVAFVVLSKICDVLGGRGLHPKFCPPTPPIAPRP
jgi:DNA-binding beta-propeller fold protein YncE